MYNRLYIIILCVSGFITTSIAQNYALVEHFTNTHCPICTRKNPQLFQVVEDNSNNVHHIAYHPPYPYDACIFYNANIEGNQTRADFYNVPGSPSAYVNGARGSAGSILLSEDKVMEAIGVPLMLEMKVDEQEVNTFTAGVERQVNINVKTLISPPAGNYKLFAAVVEKEINYNSPNGESVHHNVFRKMLPGNEGEAITLPAPGAELNFVYNFEYESGWQQEEIYVVVFIQNIDDKSVIGSASKFDQTTTSIHSREDHVPLKLVSNPVVNMLSLDIGKSLSYDTQILVTDMSGATITNWSAKKGNRVYDFDVSPLSAGMYVLRLNELNGQERSLKFIKK